MHQLTHVLRCGIAALSFLPLFTSPLNALVLADAGSIHQNAKKIKPMKARNAKRGRVAASHRFF
jgi:hypothetical protein